MEGGSTPGSERCGLEAGELPCCCLLQPVLLQHRLRSPDRSRRLKRAQDIRNRSPLPVKAVGGNVALALRRRLRRSTQFKPPEKRKKTRLSHNFCTLTGEQKASSLKCKDGLLEWPFHSRPATVQAPPPKTGPSSTLGRTNGATVMETCSGVQRGPAPTKNFLRN